MTEECERRENIKIIVHLVHGTWPDGMMWAAARRLCRRVPYPTEDGSSLWFQVDHDFRRKLENGLAQRGFTPEFHTFVWSGANSFKARMEAARDLVPHFADGIRNHTRQLVVAHSHGGNVAMLAMHVVSRSSDENTPLKSSLAGENGRGRAGDPVVDVDGTPVWLTWKRRSPARLALDQAKSVALSYEDMRKGAEDIELVTLATPFLRIEKFEPAFSLTSFFIGCWVIGFFSLAERLPSPSLFHNPLLALFANFFILMLVLWGVSEVEESLTSQIVGNHSFSGKRIRCIRGMADEASLVISLGIVGCVILRTLLMIFAKHLNQHLVQVLTALAITPAVVVMIFATDLDPSNPVFLLSKILAFAAGAFMLTMVFASLLQGTLGYELALAGLRFVTTVDSSPDADHDMTVVTLPSAGLETKLRHAIYLHPKCASEVLMGLDVSDVARAP